MLRFAPDAADRHAAEARAMTAALAPDQPLAGAFATEVVISEGDFQRGICRLRPEIGKGHVVQIARRQCRDPARQGKRFRMPEMKRRREIKFACLRSYGLDDGRAAMSGVGTPKTCGAVDDGAALWSETMHIPGIGDKTRAMFERTVGGIRHPVSIKIVSQ